MSVTDTTLTGGAPGILAHDHSTADNWAGGAASAGTGGGGGGTSSYTVGGTASGLSGTLVLRDNGGDDLTVGGNGPFTFATPVADGAGYQVTVKTSPAGQTCHGDQRLRHDRGRQRHQCGGLLRGIRPIRHAGGSV